MVYQIWMILNDLIQMLSSIWPLNNSTIFVLIHFDKFNRSLRHSPRSPVFPILKNKFNKSYCFDKNSTLVIHCPKD